MGYKYDDKIFDYFITNQTLLNEITPIYEELDGWAEDITAIKNYDELPENCKTYIEKIETNLKTPIDIISVGPDRTQTIIKNEIISKMN
jgi:adenylosuccinate synthase